MRGQQLADLGIQQAQEHAHAVIPDWTARVLDRLEWWSRTRSGVFAIEDFRVYIAAHHPELLPPSSNAWGAIGRVAVSRKIIKPFGTRPAKSARTHGHPVRTFTRYV